MKFIFTGNYEINYNRTTILKKGLESNGHEVIELPIPVKDFKSKLEDLKSITSQADYCYFPPFTHKSLPILKKTIQCPIVFDPLISKYNTNVYDYQLCRPYSFRALKDWLRDWRSLQSADFIITDTNARHKYFQYMFGVPMKKMGTVYIGEKEDFTQLNSTQIRSDKDIFRVGFIGGFIPLQGCKIIIQAAKTVSESSLPIQFYLAGTGFEFEKTKELVKELNLTNVVFPGWIKIEDLKTTIDTFDISLGIFGNTIKSNLVIPNKIYHYASRGQAIITQKSPAIQEIFTDQENINLIEPTAEELAQNIFQLYHHSKRRITLGKQAHKLMQSQFNEKKVALSLVEQLTQYFSCKNVNR